MGLEPVRCRIPELLKSRRQNQSWLASEVGCSRSEMSDICNMRNGGVLSLRRARKIAICLKCKIDDLYEWR